MKIRKLIEELENIEKDHPEIECQVVDEGILYPDFFIVPEEYQEDGWRVNIRSWPY
jgi:hypothetical protein